VPFCSWGRTVDLTEKFVLSHWYSGDGLIYKARSLCSLKEKMQVSPLHPIHPGTDPGSHVLVSEKFLGHQASLSTVKLHHMAADQVPTQIGSP
jgi:hypothetical protein